MLAIGTVTESIGSCIYEYGVNTTEGISYLAVNGDDILQQKDIGTPVLVQYTPGDQFCRILDLEEVSTALTKHFSTKDPQK